MRYSISFILVLFLLLSISPLINANDKEFDPESLRSMIVEIQIPTRDRVISQSGIIVSNRGHILTSADEPVWNLADTDEIVNIRIFPIDVTSYTVQGRFATEVIDRVALIEIIDNTSNEDNATEGFNLPHFNPVVEGGSTVSFLEAIVGVTYSNIGQDGVILTQGVINTISSSPTAPDNVEVVYYGTGITVDSTGSGGLILDQSGRFVGLLTTIDTNRQFAEIMPIGAICLENPAICQTIIQTNRPNPEIRNRPPTGTWQLINGIGQTNGTRISDGQVQMEYYCSVLGLDARTNNTQEYWECFDHTDPSQTFVLDEMHHDIICQQTYADPMAIAFQLSFEGVPPALSWRCYG